jgi:hypothetical protein
MSGGGATAYSRTDARGADSERLLRRIRAGIAGREHEPAGRVFTNIRLAIFKRIPAEDLLDVMDGGYSRALDVNCTHCHVEPAKKIVMNSNAQQR